MSLYSLILESFPLLTAGNYVVDPNGDIYVILDKIEYSLDNKFETNYRIKSLKNGNENILWEDREYIADGRKKTSYSIANDYYKKYHLGEPLPKNKFNKWYDDNPRIEDED